MLLLLRSTHRSPRLPPPHSPSPSEGTAPPTGAWCAPTSCAPGACSCAPSSSCEPRRNACQGGRGGHHSGRGTTDRGGPQWKAMPAGRIERGHQRMQGRAAHPVRDGAPGVCDARCCPRAASPPALTLTPPCVPPLPPACSRYVRIFQVCLMAFVVATCYLNVGKDTLDNGASGWRWLLAYKDRLFVFLLQDLVASVLAVPPLDCALLLRPAPCLRRAARLCRTRHTAGRSAAHPRSPLCPSPLQATS